MHDSYTAIMKIINGQNLSDYQSSIVNNLNTLIEMRSGNNFVNGFTLNETKQMIEIMVVGRWHIHINPRFTLLMMFILWISKWDQHFCKRRCYYKRLSIY